MPNNVNDLSLKEFKHFGHEIVDLIYDYYSNIENLPVLPQINPGDIEKLLPEHPPLNKEPFNNILDDVKELIVPNLTHWNHPRFMAYFNSTASPSSILAEFLIAAFGVNGMVWKTAPASSELETVVLKWFREMIGLPDKFWGIIYDTASVSSMHAIASAREAISELNIRTKGMLGRENTPRLRLYCSEQAHASIEKGALTLGIGLEGVRKISCDAEFKMNINELASAIKEDRINGWLPFCVVATIGTTSTTSYDDVKEISRICSQENIWLHVDAAYAGVTAMLPEYKDIFEGISEADSIVVNPHKWMFMPLDLSILYTKKPEILKSAFSLVPEYLKTGQDNTAINRMDYGIQLGRRFRALKLWFVIRSFGVEGIRANLREHIRLANLFSSWIDNHADFERLAPVPFSVVCFRALFSKDESLNNKLNEKLMEEINQTGFMLLSHTKLNSKFIIRFVVSGLYTNEKHVIEAWDFINKKYLELKKKMEV